MIDVSVYLERLEILRLILHSRIDNRYFYLSHGLTSRQIMQFYEETGVLILSI